MSTRPLIVTVVALRFGWVAQLAEQRTENPRVGGSIPPPARLRFFSKKRTFSLRKSRESENRESESSPAKSTVCRDCVWYSLIPMSSSTAAANVRFGEPPKVRAGLALAREARGLPEQFNY
jgi:hypothetical protein